MSCLMSGSWVGLHGSEEGGEGVGVGLRGEERAPANWGLLSGREVGGGRGCGGDGLPLFLSYRFQNVHEH